MHESGAMYAIEASAGAFVRVAVAEEDVD